MKQIEKAFAICFAIQAVMIVILIVGGVFLSLGNRLFVLHGWQFTIIFFGNFLVCGHIFSSAYKKTLKEIDSSIYEKLYGDPLSGNTVKFLMFAFTSEKDDTAEIMQMKKYMRRCYLLCLVAFFQIPFWTFIYG